MLLARRYLDIMDYLLVKQPTMLVKYIISAYFKIKDP